VHVSSYLAGRFGSGTDRDIVIYPGSDTDFFSMPPGAAPADDSVGMVYRLQREKLDDTILDPLIDVVRRRPGSRAYVIGGGELLSLYRTAAADAGVVERMEFPGYVPYETLPDWYARLAVFVAPVTQESFGQVVPFAMSMGIPVVGYGVGALPEIIGDTDLLVPPGDSEGLARLVAALLDDQGRRLDISRRNRARAVERFSLPAMVSAYRALYDSVATKTMPRVGSSVGGEAVSSVQTWTMRTPPP
jgi:glycosyltransferase involved in cell wall biosynthesis